jgi:hypothetical protein
LFGEEEATSVTEAEWLACEDAKRMVTHLGQSVTKRKLLRLACACCFRVEALINLDAAREALSVAESIESDESERRVRLEELLQEVDHYTQGQRYDHPRLAALCGVKYTLRFATGSRPYIGGNTLSLFAHAVASRAYPTAQYRHNNPNDSRPDDPAWRAMFDGERRAQAVLVRDIFGNPFRPVAFSPSWLTDTTVSLARQIYEGRDFSAMPILADALQDAGCDNADILDHCRGSGPHVRGCWVVDMALGKE